MHPLKSIIQTVAILFGLIKRQSYYIIKTGNCCDAHIDILNDLHKHNYGLKEIKTEEECDVIFVFCPIVSRAGTDIEAALRQLNACSESKQAVFIVLHHTFNPEKIVPDSSRFISRSNTLTVDCLFNEDMRLLKCEKNRRALAKICFKQNQGFTIPHFFSWRNMCFAATATILLYVAYVNYNRSK